MVAVWTQTLMSAAEISNFFSALGVVVCFICMVIFILRVQGIQLASPSVVHAVQSSPFQVNYEKVEIPFVCFLKTTNVTSDELEFDVTINVSCYFQVFWCVPAIHLRDLLYIPWRDFAEKMETDNSLQAEKVEDKRVLEPQEASPTCLIRLTKDSSCNSLGQAPRTHFPLVIILSRKNKSLNNNCGVGAFISVVHISDEVFPMPTTMLYQYLKQYSGQLSPLQTLYTQKPQPNFYESQAAPGADNPPSATSSFSECFENEATEDEACVICRVTKPTRALLPCRHVCVCSFCFGHFEVCPLCRSRISAFFLTDPKEEERQAAEKEDITRRNKEEADLQRHRSFLNNMNGVLNSLLGLRDP